MILLGYNLECYLFVCILYVWVWMCRWWCNMCKRQCGYIGQEKVCMYSKAVCVHEGKQSGYVGRNNVFPSVVVGICWSCLFILCPSWLCNMETERALAQNVWLCLAGCCTIPRVPWGCMQAQTNYQPILKQEDEESRTNSPSLLALKDYLVWLFSCSLHSNPMPLIVAPSWPRYPLWNRLIG